MRPRAALLGMVLCGWATGGCATQAVTPSVVALPRETVMTLDGAPAELTRIAEGRVALVSLWATWCDACSKEFDALNRLSAGAAKRRDALVIGVAVGEQHRTVEAFVKTHDVRYAQLVDEDFRLADALGQRDVPATLVIDRAGRIVYRGEGLDARGLDAFRKTLSQEP